MAIALQRLGNGRTATLRTALRDAVFASLALLIVFGPAVPQLLGEKPYLLRSWKMYGSAGNGLFKGTFTLHADGRDTNLSPLQVLGLAHYPSVIDYKFISRITADDPAVALGDACARIGQNERLSFSGWRGTRDGWQPLTTDDVCRSRL
jgi:hypothetical protein